MKPELPYFKLQISFANNLESSFTQYWIDEHK